MIYGLVDPRDHVIKYVGQSKHGLRRAYEHFTGYSLAYRCKKNDWLRELMQSNLYPKAVIIERCDSKDLDTKEMYWIDHYRKIIGDCFTNMAMGGSGGNTGMAQKKHKPVISINLDTKEEKEYAFVWQTEQDGFSPTKVVAVCKGKRISHKGHYFHYKTASPLIRESKSCRALIVKDLLNNTEQAFAKHKDVALALGMSVSNLHNILRTKRVFRHRYVIEQTRNMS